MSIGRFKAYVILMQNYRKGTAALVFSAAVPLMFCYAKYITTHSGMKRCRDSIPLHRSFYDSRYFNFSSYLSILSS